jgi:hypothetical protein
MIEKLQKQLQQLIQEREQTQIALLNYNGAIAILQKLINEEQAPQQQEQAKPEAKKLKVVKSAPTDPSSN